MSPFNLRAIILAALLPLAALAGCSDRERSNPLDPKNPDRDRQNIGFNAFAGNGQVLLEWDRLDFIDLAGIRVQRTVAGTIDTVTVTDSTLPLTATRFIDNGVSNGETYTYNLLFDVKDSDERPTTLPDTATPGEVFTWVELLDFGEVVLLTPDLRDELHGLNGVFFDVVDIQVGSLVWVLEGPRSSGAIHRFDISGQIESEDLLNNVSAFRLDPSTGRAWVSSSSENGLVYWFQRNGDLINSKSVGQPVTSIAWDRAGGRLWLGSSEPSIASIGLSGFNSTVFSHSDFVNPQQVVASQGRQGVWIADDGGNEAHYFADGSLQWSRGGFAEVNDIMVDDGGTVCWVADAPGDRVVALDAVSGEELAALTGFGKPFYLAYNPVKQQLYVSGSSGQITVVNIDHQKELQVTFPERLGKIAPMF